MFAIAALVGCRDNTQAGSGVDTGSTNSGANNSGKTQPSGTQSGKLETVGFVSKRWFDDKTKRPEFTIKNYKVTFNDAPAFDEITWMTYIYTETVDFTNCAGGDTVYPDDYTCWDIYLYPAKPENDFAETWLAKDSLDFSKRIKIPVTKVEVLDNQYFDPASGHPFKLKVSIKGYPDMIIAGSKK
ncbi:hypothetical protein [Treponema phagedenis]|uniref:Uncharacterized protein n=1 Tax=Treponema phagedenis TaxID=162 RepID=A0AAE6M810_TREPH|nr:hypothetical protein [Treponema phagedenis]QEJ97007.1 hypothetical protein FUT82_02745 [Treponema phagedenis]QEJ97424.1 hypothetical protein FUT82_05030 [Treponema phagedenis]QEK02446.1 hypothetical protein FUT83_00625 [Treponema phagedenis]QEK08076.1 hypothetical protein FUT81_00625 [Treponema phagedenis]QEK09917.1 hypothetical protein FUT81_11050 [Treponema phagedenis]